MKGLLKSICVFFCIFFIPFLDMPVEASETSVNNNENTQEEIQAQVQEQLDILSKSGVEETIPESATDILDELELKDFNLSSLIKLTPSKLFKVLLNSVKTALLAPARVLGRLIGVMLLCGMMYALQSSAFGSEMKQVFSVVSVLCVVSFLATPVIDCIVRTATALRECSLFILSFLPVFSGVIMAAGNPVAASGYNLFLFWACQIVSDLAADTLIPLMGIYFAFCIVSAVVPQLEMTGIANGIKTFVCWGLGLLTTIFVGMLSFQTIVSTGTDSLSMKTSKFLMGSFVPVIGGVLSDALSAARGYLNLLKGAVGSFGVLAAAATFFPVLMQVLIWYIVVTIGGYLGNMLQAKEVATILKSASATLSVLLAAIMCFALLIIVSTTVVIVMTTGGM